MFAARCLSAAILGLLVETAVAQTPNLPRLTDGRPDLQGVWESRWMTPLERPPAAQRLSLSDHEAPDFHAAMMRMRASRPVNANPDSDLDMVGLVKVDGAYRTSLITDPPDGRLPFTEEGRRKANGPHLFSADHPEHRMPAERCISGTGRAPMMSPPTNAFIEIIQPPNQVVITAELMNDVRIIPLGPATSLPFPTFAGDASARWEGDILVIETRNIRDDLRYAPPQSTVVLSPASVVVERIEPISATEFKYSFTVNDPVLYGRPWSAETTYIRTDARIYEYACHEGNYGLANILRGGREIDRRSEGSPGQAIER